MQLHAHCILHSCLKINFNCMQNIFVNKKCMYWLRFICMFSIIILYTCPWCVYMFLILSEMWFHSTFNAVSSLENPRIVLPTIALVRPWLSHKHWASQAHFFGCFSIFSLEIYPFIFFIITVLCLLYKLHINKCKNVNTRYFLKIHTLFIIFYVNVEWYGIGMALFIFQLKLFGFDSEKLQIWMSNMADPRRPDRIQRLVCLHRFI